MSLLDSLSAAISLAVTKCLQEALDSAPDSTPASLAARLQDALKIGAPPSKKKTKEKRSRRAEPGLRTQCRYCQKLGHSQKTCDAEGPTCGVCAEKHHTVVCIDRRKAGKTVL